MLWHLNICREAKMNPSSRRSSVVTVHKTGFSTSCPDVQCRKRESSYGMPWNQRWFGNGLKHHMIVPNFSARLVSRRNVAFSALAGRWWSLLKDPGFLARDCLQLNRRGPPLQTLPDAPLEWSGAPFQNGLQRLCRALNRDPPPSQTNRTYAGPLVRRTARIPGRDPSSQILTLEHLHEVLWGAFLKRVVCSPSCLLAHFQSLCRAGENVSMGQHSQLHLRLWCIWGTKVILKQLNQRMEKITCPRITTALQTSSFGRKMQTPGAPFSRMKEGAEDPLWTGWLFTILFGTLPCLMY